MYKQRTLYATTTIDDGHTRYYTFLCAERELDKVWCGDALKPTDIQLTMVPFFCEIQYSIILLKYLSIEALKGIGSDNFHLTDMNYSNLDVLYFQYYDLSNNVLKNMKTDLNSPSSYFRSTLLIY